MGRQGRAGPLHTCKFDTVATMLHDKKNKNEHANKQKKQKQQKEKEAKSEGCIYACEVRQGTASMIASKIVKYRLRCVVTVSTPPSSAAKVSFNFVNPDMERHNNNKIFEACVKGKARGSGP